MYSAQSLFSLTQRIEGAFWKATYSRRTETWRVLAVANGLPKMAVFVKHEADFDLEWYSVQ
jgi:hypothetical protein